MRANKDSGNNWKYVSKWMNNISLVLTGAAFYHKVLDVYCFLSLIGYVCCVCILVFPYMYLLWPCHVLAVAMWL